MGKVAALGKGANPSKKKVATGHLGRKKNANDGAPVSFGILLGFLYMLTLTAGGFKFPAAGRGSMAKTFKMFPAAGVGIACVRWVISEVMKNNFPGVSASSPVIQALAEMTDRKLRELVGAANGIPRNAPGTAEKFRKLA
eukprot:gene13146-563_t